MTKREMREQRRARRPQKKCKRQSGEPRIANRTRFIACR